MILGCVVSTMILLAGCESAHAALRDKYIDGAALCTQHFPEQERRHGIPSHLLAAIASTESGRWHDRLGMRLPWPWTINAEGKGYYFDSKAEAMRKVYALKRDGVDSIDIGCMQVNLRHHPEAFANLSQAFDPAYNVGYAAKFLRSNFDESGSWITAAKYYHSRTPSLGNKYLGLVEQAWNSITGKVKTARLNTGIPNTAQRSSQAKRYVVTGEGAKAFAALESRQSSTGKVQAYNRNTSSAQARNQRRESMKVIEVKTVKRNPEVMVVRPTASRVSTSDLLIKGADRASKQVSLGSSNASNATSRGPKTAFVFSD